MDFITAEYYFQYGRIETFSNIYTENSMDSTLKQTIDIRTSKTRPMHINDDSRLSNKRLFAPECDDGMSVEVRGNVYITQDGISVYTSGGEKIRTIEVPESPSNICFGGDNMRTLYITAQTSLYAIKMNVSGR